MKAKKILVTLLAAAMAVSTFAACGSSDGGKESSGGSESSKVSASFSEDASGSDETETLSYVNATGLPIVNEPITLKMMVVKNVSDLGKSWNEKECVKRAVEETGINFEFTEISQAAWSEQIGVTLAGGDLPDVIVGSINNFAAYTESFLPLNDLLDTYAPNLTAFYEKNPELKVAGTMEDGNLYSFPLFQQQGYYTHNNRYAINQEWLDNVGMEIPTTQDELYEVLTAFKEQDANGNGDANDELPISFTGNTAAALDANAYGMNFLFNCCGIHSVNYVQVEDGVVSFAPTTEEYRQFLEFANKLYTEGLIDPDSFVQQVPDYTAKGNADRIGIVAHHSYLDIVVGAQNMAKYSIMLPTKDANGDVTVTGRSVNGDWNYDCYKVSKDSKYAEAAVRLYDYVISSEELVTLWSWGPEGDVYTVNEEGKKERVSEFTDGMTSFAQARQTYSAGMSGFWIYPKDMYQSWVMQPRDQLMKDFEETYTPYLAEPMPLGIDKQEVVDRRADQFTEINTYIQNFTAESIMKGIDDSGWEKHLKTCESLDVATYTEDYQNFYNDKKVD